MITSIHNLQIKFALKLKQKKWRQQHQLFLCEGDHLIAEGERCQVIKVIYTSNPQKKGILVSADIIKALSTTVTPQDRVAVASYLKSKPLGKMVVAVENLQDPGNLGTIMRSMVAFGFHDLIVQGVDIYNAKVIRASQGAIFYLNIIQVSALSGYFDKYYLIGTLLNKAAKDYRQISLPAEPIMLILGNEGKGLSAKTQAALDLAIYIPVQFESLNVAIATSIILAHWTKH